MSMVNCLSWIEPALPMEMEGETFSRVFGTNTALFEQFVLIRNIMGPCWIKIDSANFVGVQNVSFCTLDTGVF
jgi:DNA polymerase alpha subunit A